SRHGNGISTSTLHLFIDQHLVGCGRDEVCNHLSSHIRIVSSSQVCVYMGIGSCCHLAINLLLVLHIKQGILHLEVILHRVVNRLLHRHLMALPGSVRLLSKHHGG